MHACQPDLLIAADPTELVTRIEARLAYPASSRASLSQLHLRQQKRPGTLNSRFIVLLLVFIVGDVIFVDVCRLYIGITTGDRNSPKGACLDCRQYYAGRWFG